MPVYAKKVKSNDQRFQGREIMVASANPAYGNIEQSRIPVPNNVVLCGGCNQNISEMETPEGYLVYLSNRELQQDHPYDIFCPDCFHQSFSKAIMVD